MADEIFRDAVAHIAQAYKELGHNCGWVFLHTSARTLDPHTRLLFVALNPASKTNSEPQESDEGGNGYYLRNWKGNTKSILQRQVCAFYQMLATKLGTNWESLMDSSLAGNFCPFGSPSWADLPEKQKSIEFSTKLWSRIVQYCSPKALVCLGQVCYRSMRDVTITAGYHSVGDPGLHPTARRHRFGGAINYVMEEMNGRKRLLLVGLPHLSRYQVFGRAYSGECFSPLMQKLADYYSESFTSR
jgi:hypothetical protein